MGSVDICAVLSVRFRQEKTQTFTFPAPTNRGSPLCTLAGIDTAESTESWAATSPAAVNPYSQFCLLRVVITRSGHHARSTWQEVVHDHPLLLQIASLVLSNSDDDLPRLDLYIWLCECDADSEQVKEMLPAFSATLDRTAAGAGHCGDKLAVCIATNVLMSPVSSTIVRWRYNPLRISELEKVLGRCSFS
jgi:hypothetical protein